MSQRLFQDLPDSQLSPCVYLVSVVVARVVKVVADAEKVICFTLKLKKFICITLKLEKLMRFF